MSNQQEDKEGKPPNSHRDFRDESCFSAEISHIEHASKYSERRDRDHKGAVSYHEISEANANDAHTQCNMASVLDMLNSYYDNRQKKKLQEDRKGKLFVDRLVIRTPNEPIPCFQTWLVFYEFSLNLKRERVKRCF